MALSPREFNKQAEEAAEERNRNYPALKAAGMRDADIARYWGISRERVRQIAKRFKQPEPA